MRTKNKGFTLLEIIIVLFLITLVAGLSSVLFTKALPSERFKSTARQIAAAIKHARVTATSSGEIRTLIINLNEKTYSVEGKKTKDIPPEIDIFIIDSMAKEMRNGIVNMTFYPSGGMEIYSIVLSYGKKQITIKPDPIVGSVQIKN